MSLVFPPFLGGFVTENDGGSFSLLAASFLPNYSTPSFSIFFVTSPPSRQEKTGASFSSLTVPLFPPSHSASRPITDHHHHSGTRTLGQQARHITHNACTAYAHNHHISPASQPAQPQPPNQKTNGRSAERNSAQHKADKGAGLGSFQRPISNQQRPNPFPFPLLFRSVSRSVNRSFTSWLWWRWRWRRRPSCPPSPAVFVVLGFEFLIGFRF
jgi:hypothetical protein